MTNQLFTDSDNKKIEAAIKAAEKKTNGEIVVHVSEQSDFYFRGALTCSLALGFSFLVLSYVAAVFFPETVLRHFELISILVFIVSFGLAYIFPSIRILFVPQKELLLRVVQKAQLIFFQRELFQTKDRTGLLIFISLLERKVEVLGDTEINKQIAPEQWVTIVNAITAGIKNKNASDGVIKGISLAADLLVTSDFHIQPDDENELPNTVSFD